KDSKTSTPKSWISQLATAIRRHPVTSIILSTYVIIMVQESSWFFKEILTWYDDIYTDHLLSNFSLRQSFITETMRRNDFRFFPLSHQDLHALSWLTPYTKVWSLVSAIELTITIILGCKVVQIINKNKSSGSLFLMGSLLFLFTSATAYNYFQFIYSERFLTFLLAGFIYQYCLYQNSRQQKNGRLALLFALFIPFFKDSAILLAVVPALTTITLGSIGKLNNYPRWNTLKPSDWARAYALELAIFSLAAFFLASFVMLSGLPSLFAGVERYDAHLGFSTLKLDIRLVILIGFIATRLWLLCRNHTQANALDGLNIAVLSYGFSLYALVGLEADNYMTLPLQFVAVIDMVMIWETLAVPWLSKRLSIRQTQAAALGATLLVLGIEDRQAETFRQRATFLSWKQKSWRKTYNKADETVKEARKKGEVVNLIYSKGWFKNSEEMKKLTYDRLVYYDIDSRTYKIKDGIDRGLSYKPKKGDFLVDIDTGKKLTEYGIDLSRYQLLYQENINKRYARIFRHL
ncbi:hypothetical protein OAK65_04985, partial [Synechococcus sp. AH-551-N17]|nr:hypothetical protein [Synechococcus sp. AH-551-N17]